MPSVVMSTVGNKPITTPSVERVTLYNSAGESRTVWPVDAKELCATGRWSEAPPEATGIEAAQEQVRKKGKRESGNAGSTQETEE